MVDHDLNPEELERMVPLAAERADDRRPFARRGDSTLETRPEPMRPWSVGEVLDVSLDVFRERFLTIAGTCVLLWFPLRAAMPFIALHNWLNVESAEMILSGLGAFGVWTVLAGGVSTFCVGAVAQLTLATLERRELTMRTALSVTLKRFFSLVVLLAPLAFLVTYFGTLCFVLPGVYLSWKFWVAKPALVLEGAPLGTAIQRSFELTTGTFWRWLAIAFARGMFVGLLGYTVSMPDDPTLRTVILDAVPISPTTLDVVNVFVSSIVIGTLTALSAVIETVFYVDCRVRRDGYDLDLALDRIETRAGARAERGARPAADVGAPELLGGAS